MGLSPTRTPTVGECPIPHATRSQSPKVQSVLKNVAQPLAAARRLRLLWLLAFTIARLASALACFVLSVGGVPLLLEELKGGGVLALVLIAEIVIKYSEFRAGAPLLNRVASFGRWPKELNEGRWSW